MKIIRGCRLLGLAWGISQLLMPVVVQAAETDTRLAELETRIGAIERNTTYVEDLTRIQRLQRAFGYYLDKGYFGEAAQLFTEDARVQYGVDGVYIGQARIQELFTRHGGGSVTAGPGLPFGRINMHMQLQPMITVADDGQAAQGRWREWALLGNYHDKAEWGDAILENDYVKEGGVWKIAEMRYYPNFVAPYEGGWASLDAVTGNWQTDVSNEFAPDEPSPLDYKPFPDVFLPPYHYHASEQQGQTHDLGAIQSDPPVAELVSRPDDALGRLEARTDEEAAKLARVRSLRAIENLQAMYGYYTDKGQWQAAAALFAEDGTWEFGQRGVYVGPQSIERGLPLMGPGQLGTEGLQQGELNNYPMLQPIIHVSADNSRAWGRWRSDVMLARDGKGLWGGGLYENEYVNEGGTWKISKQHYWVTFWGDYDLGWTGEGIIPVQPASTEIPPDAPPTVEYESLPNTYIVPFHFDNPVTGRPHDDLVKAEQAAAEGEG